MKLFTYRRTIAVASAALLVLMPAAGLAQTPQPPDTSSQQGTSAGQHQHDAQQHMQHGKQNEHLRLADAALDSISAESVTGTAKDRVGELKQHVNSLKAAPCCAAGETTSGAASQHPASPVNWKSEVAAIDRILNELIGPEGAAAAAGATPQTSAGTTGSAGVTLDDATRSKLQEVRKHVTNFAAQMTGSAPAGQTSSSSSTTSSARSTETTSAASGTTSTSPGTTATQSAEPQTPTAETQQAQGGIETQAQPDKQEAKVHLTAARDTLSQMTQLPAAAQLTGETRTQVAELISNFNELIATNTDWRASYERVRSSLNALLADEPQATPPEAPDAVGTSGTSTVDPSIREKLVEFRKHLLAFEQAVGASGSEGVQSPSTPPAGTSTEPEK